MVNSYFIVSNTHKLENWSSTDYLTGVSKGIWTLMLNFSEMHQVHKLSCSEFFLHMLRIGDCGWNPETD